MSSYVWSALPMVLSGLAAFVTEQEAMFKDQRDEGRVKKLGEELPAQFMKLYGVSGGLLERLKDLVELRNEIIHPAHLATGTADNWPEELRETKNRGVLNSPGGLGDYLMLDQMKSLRLLDWAMDIVVQLKAKVVEYHTEKRSSGLISNPNLNP